VKGAGLNTRERLRVIARKRTLESETTRAASPLNAPTEFGRGAPYIAFQHAARKPDWYTVAADEAQPANQSS
jgi:hypothetical protein